MRIAHHGAPSSSAIGGVCRGSARRSTACQRTSSQDYRGPRPPHTAHDLGVGWRGLPAVHQSPGDRSGLRRRGGAVTVTVVVLVLVTTLVDGLGSTVVGGGGVLVSVIVTVSVCVSVAGAVVVGVIGVSVVVGVLSAWSVSEPKTTQTSDARINATSTPAANITAGERYHGTGSSTGGP